MISEKRLSETSAGARWGGSTGDSRRRKQQIHHLAEEIRISPEHVECLLEHRAMFDSIDQTRLQHVMQLGSRGHPGNLKSLQRQQRTIRSDREACLA
jgi:hypothetical protein